MRFIDKLMLPQLHGAAPIGLLLLRLMVGYVMVYHGWGKVSADGFPDGFASKLTGMGVPMPMLSAYLAAYAELIGGALVMLGLFTRLACIPLIITMAVAVFASHWSKGFSMATEGYEYAATLGVAFVTLLLAGPGALALESLFTNRPASGASQRG